MQARKGGWGTWYWNSWLFFYAVWNSKDFFKLFLLYLKMTKNLNFIELETCFSRIDHQVFKKVCHVTRSAKTLIDTFKSSKWTHTFWITIVHFASYAEKINITFGKIHHLFLQQEVEKNSEMDSDPLLGKLC